MSIKRLVSCAQDFQVMCHRRAGRERERGERGRVDERDDTLTCDYCNHLRGDTSSIHCKTIHYTLHKNLPLILLYTRYNTCTKCHYCLPPASLHPFCPYISSGQLNFFKESIEVSQI